jgi:hypothetical protein
MMSMMNLETMMAGTRTADLAFFTPTVKPLLERFNSSAGCSQSTDVSTKMPLGAGEMAFIADQEWFYLAAIGQDGWPYTQRHCGEKGFLRVLDATTVGFASMANTQRYVSDGRALLFLIDHASQARLRIWADAQLSAHPETMEQLAIRRCDGTAEHAAFLFHVRAFAWGAKEHAKERSTVRADTIATARPLKSHGLLKHGIPAKCCLSLDAASGVWTLNSHTVGGGSDMRIESNAAGSPPRSVSIA